MLALLVLTFGTCTCCTITLKLLACPLVLPHTWRRLLMGSANTATTVAITDASYLPVLFYYRHTTKLYYDPSLGFWPIAPSGLRTLVYTSSPALALPVHLEL
jgi:hypothetical protein